MTPVDATAFLESYAQRRVQRPVLLQLDDHTYPLEASPAESWLPIAFRAFARIARTTEVRDILVVGTGNGLDALAAAEIFDDLRSLTVTDLHEPCVELSRANLLANLDPSAGIEVRAYAGSLLSCVPPELRFSLLYENLPNIPATADVDLRRGLLSGRFYDDAGLAVPEPFGRYLLALHHQLLEEARGRLVEGGGVLMALGGRMPLEVAFDLHRACGYEPELAAFDLKLQAEPQLVIPPYARAEEATGVEFTYYGPEIVERAREVRRAGLDGQELHDALAGDLSRLAMSARQAEERADRGEPVAHSVLEIFGRR